MGRRARHPRQGLSPWMRALAWQYARGLWGPAGTDMRAFARSHGL